MSDFQNMRPLPLESVCRFHVGTIFFCPARVLRRLATNSQRVAKRCKSRAIVTRLCAALSVRLGVVVGAVAN